MTNVNYSIFERKTKRVEHRNSIRLLNFSINICTRNHTSVFVIFLIIESRKAMYCDRLYDICSHQLKYLKFKKVKELVGANRPFYILEI